MNLCGKTKGAAMILRSLGCHGRGGFPELPRHSFNELGFLQIKITSF
jgi:hypothetical protein